MKSILAVAVTVGALASADAAQAAHAPEAPQRPNPETTTPPADPPGTLDTQDAMDHGVEGTVPPGRPPMRSPVQPAPKAENPANPVKLIARLDGSSEAGGKGDRDALGVFAGRLNRAQGQLCYSMKVTNLQTPTAARIHAGPAGKAGEVAVRLEAPANGEATGCVEVAREVAEALIASPQNFYVNIENREFKKGAIRGQLSEG